MSSRWVVGDMDEGIVHGDETRKACVEWILNHSGGVVLARHQYGRGNYEYFVGYPGEDHHDNWFVMTPAKAAAAGFSNERIEGSNE